MRYLYTFLLYLALPYIFVRLWWRSQRLPAYRQRWGERLGFYARKLDKCIWVHAVSVGETVAAVPLIKALQQRYPAIPILVTTMTPTGAARVQSEFGDSVTHAYIPYDYPGAVRRFLTALQPILGVIMETEMWPNLLAACQQRHIPICMMNARLSEKSARGYERVAKLTRDMLQAITVIAAQAQADADRFVALGAVRERVEVTGSIKFDLSIPLDLENKRIILREKLGKDRFIWIAASTHAGEEEQILRAHLQVREHNPDALLILVPRHPDRFDVVATLCERATKTQRHSLQQDCAADVSVYLGDSMGELLLLYAVSDVAFVGGSLIARGGHNLLEPAALQKAVLTGPYLHNFADISELLISANALTVVANVDALVQQIVWLMQHPDARAAQAERALAVINANRGALAKQLALINAHLLI